MGILHTFKINGIQKSEESPEYGNVYRKAGNYMAEKAQMNRHDSRKTVFSLLYAKEYYPELDGREFLQGNSEIAEVPFNTYIVSTFLGTVNHMDAIDTELEQRSVKWKVSRMAKVTRSILRLAIYELLYVENPIPPKAVINEAVELAKEFDDDAAPAFINGILNKLARDHGKLGEAVPQEAGEEVPEEQTDSTEEIV